MNYPNQKSLAVLIRIAVSVMWYAQLALYTIVVCGVLIGVSFRADRSYRWPVTFSAGAYKEISTAGRGAADVKVIVTSGELLFTGTNNWQNIAITITGLALIFGTFLFVTFQLKKICSSFTGQDPFNASNSFRIRWIGIILILSALLRFVFGIFFTSYINTHFQWNDGVSFTQPLDVSSLFMGLLVLILAEVFRTGNELQEEKKLTI